MIVGGCARAPVLQRFRFPVASMQSCSLPLMLRADVRAPPAGSVKKFTFDFSYNSFVERDHPEYASQTAVWADIGVGVLENAYSGAARELWRTRQRRPFQPCCAAHCDSLVIFSRRLQLFVVRVRPNGCWQELLHGGLRRGRWYHPNGAYGRRLGVRFNRCVTPVVLSRLPCAGVQQDL